MAKFYGNVGYIETVEIEPGIWEPVETVYPYSGDFVRNSSMFQTSDSTNDDIKIANEISIVADPYAIKKFPYIRYVEYMGVKWKVTNVDANKYPRLILTVGGVYNGK